ncbi:hypothetical protein DFO77_1661 [Marinilabilia salmonicolor]|uniref:Uncharacterized protein n=1 Tax=Marinilabilia salmonicolor TaxID=989 RepID=A0A368UKI6_9BACT|nr:hypothetical protein DFO77_1661 [Marinilabilia salmonicolor]
MELLLRQIPNDYSYKKGFLDKNIEDLEILFLGSSHTYYGINPKLIEIPSFNASHISQTIDLDFEILKKYKDGFENLDFIVIPIDYFTLFSRMSTGKEAWRIKNYNIYYNFCMTSNINYYFELSSINLENNKTRIISYYLKNESSITCNKFGYGNIEREQVDLVETGKTAAKRHTKEIKSYLDKNLNIVNKIIKL